jgi:CpeT/CpcT family (DUF1001)
MLASHSQAVYNWLQTIAFLVHRIPPMPLHPDILHLGQELAGFYDNRDQAIADPVWYVSLQAWWRPVPLFTEDSITLFAEQANALQPDRPYRQRLLRLHAPEGNLTAQFYQFDRPDFVLGAGANTDLVDAIVNATIQILPTGKLSIQPIAQGFSARSNPGESCKFSFRDPQGNEKLGQVELGFSTQPGQWWSYDKGINPETGQAIWGAMMGPYRFIKRSPYPLVN